MPGRLRLLAALLVLALQACAPPVRPGGAALTPVGFAALPGWTEDRLDGALTAISRSCARIAALDPAQPLGPPAFGAARDWQEVCRAGQVRNSR